MKNWIFNKQRISTKYAVITVALLLLLPLSGGCTKPQSKEEAKGKIMRILQKKPVYSLKVEVFGVAHYIKINDVTVFFDTDDEGQISVILPVNHWMRSGENTISFNLYPPEPGKPFNPNSYIKIALMVNEFSEPDKEYTVATLHFNGTKDANQSHTDGSSQSGIYDSTKGFVQDKDGDVRVYDVTATHRPMDDFKGAMTFKRKINIPSSLPLWAFFKSEEMPDYYSIQDDNEYYKAIASLYAAYEKIQNALAKRDVDAILPMFEERNHETDMAHYLEPGTTANNMRDSLLETVNDLKENNLELVKLPIDNCIYHLEDNKKIVSLRRNGLGSAIALNYINKKRGMGSTRYPMFFRYSNGKYILTR